jgi:hypothetical protein
MPLSLKALTDPRYQLRSRYIGLFQPCAYILSEAGDRAERFSTVSFEMSEAMLWPAAGSVEKDDLINGLPLAFQF